MSSPWSALLESLHSAFIDELNERQPEKKPILGLPLRVVGFQPPPEAQAVARLGVRIQGDSRHGVLFLAISDLGILKGVEKAGLEVFLGAITRRAEKEFERRKISPTVFGEYPEKVSISIWIPIELEAKWFIGVGV